MEMAESAGRPFTSRPAVPPRPPKAVSQAAKAAFENPQSLSYLKKCALGPCGSAAIGATLAGVSGALGRSIMQLKIATHTSEGVTILECSGRIVFGDEAAALREQVKDLVAAGKKQIVLNLGGITYIDSGGLGTLVGLYTTARNAGGAIKLANLTQRVGDLLQVTKLLTVFDVYDSQDKAIKAFGKVAVA